jgi:signal transduction histidine kinase/ABC-type nitrate/sulfonate/bicarbonate transport system substrate-binding protein
MKIVFLILIFMISLVAQEDLEKVSLQLKWKYQFQFSGFIAAKEKGFYKEEGIDVNLLEYDESTDTLDAMQKGEIQFGVSDSALILEAMKGVPVVAMMAIYQKSPYILMALKSSNINNINDINDKKLAIYDDINGKAIKSILKAHHVEFTQESVDNKLTKLQNRQVDVIIAYISNEPYVAKEMGMDLTLIDPNDYGFERYGDILFTSKEIVQKRPELVDKMYRASYKGFEYAFTHIDEMVELIYHKYNTQNKTKEALRYEANTLKKLSEHKEGFGKLSREKIESIAYICSMLKLGKYNLANLDDFIYKENRSKIELTKEELTYLKNKKIRVCVHPDLYPLEFIKDGKHKGISADFMQLLTKEYPFNFELILAKNDEEVFRNVFASKCDLKTAVLHQYNLVSEYMDETNIIATDPLVLITTNNKPFTENIFLVEGKKIAVANNAIKNFVKDKYPLLDIIVIPNIETVIDQLKDDEIYGFIGLSLFANTVVQKYGFNTLKVNTKLSPHITKGVIGISKKEPQLLAIINKLLKTVPKNEIDNIKTRWAIKTYHQIVDYTLIWKILIISLFTILLILYWTVKYKREIERRRIAENNLQQLNLSLKDAVEAEVEKNREKDKQILQQSRMAQMGEMIAMIAHQWRQPLAAISATSASIELKASLNKLDNDTAKQKAQDISNFSQHLSKTIDDFRNFFKPNKKRTETSYCMLLKSVFEIIGISIKNKNIKLIKELNCHDRFNTYPNELRQVILNLIKNAEDILIDMQIENPYIKISTYKEEDKYFLEISDNAGGVPEDIIDKIFNPYFSTKTQKEGTGLGLYMSKTIIEEHCNGELTVTNGDDGAIFMIVIENENI